MSSIIHGYLRVAGSLYWVARELTGREAGFLVRRRLRQSADPLGPGNEEVAQRRLAMLIVAVAGDAIGDARMVLERGRERETVEAVDKLKNVLILAGAFNG